MPVCVGPGRKSRRPVFSRRGSFKCILVSIRISFLVAFLAVSHDKLYSEPHHEKTRFLHVRKQSCFRYTDSTLYKKIKLLTCFCDCTGQFVSDLVRNCEDRFSRVVAHISYVVILADSMVVIKIISQLSYLFVL